MAETIHVRGEGGAILTMDLPLPEGIAERYERGLLPRVNADGTPYAGAPAAVEGDDAGPGQGGSDLTAGRVPRPAVNASKAEWIAFVVGQGHVSAEDAANYTKADLIEMWS
ncbi:MULTISPECIES: hypothetical protein [unclassified Streptomyces]|uniref:hypothetical protein n=1 Tax=unclassified Streptomyces TaxID=2593676 RepID=UPI000CD4A724|nr:MULTISPECIES: hypothetical protein [unclassified Streptomyces]AWL39669.1 hypothetical protein B9S64_17395 [Streptomyces sp. SM18]